MKQNILYILIIIILSSCSSKSKADLINNYEKHSTEIIELKEYFNRIVPKDYLVRIRYDSSDEIDFFVYEPIPNSEKRELLFRKWNIDYNDYKEIPQTDYENKYHGKTNSLELVKEKLNWTNNTFSELYEKLENVNCMGISNRKPTEIEFGFIGMGAFSYLIFDENLDEKQQEDYSDDCSLLFYKNNIVFTYGSGAIGSFCTPEFKRNN